MSDTTRNPPAHHRDVTLAKRLRSRTFVGQDAVDAIHGLKLPFHFGRPLVRYCVVRGIRHHLEFATGEAAILKGAMPEFTTAINARLIMSNQIPEMGSSEEMPYCIWHPDLPSEDTLRLLNQKYPEMRYQVGRACAIAGYTSLYETLDILPEIAIAEEARELGHTDIYEHIMKAVVKWKVFDDYTCSLSLLAPAAAYLNGDTTVVGNLSRRQGFSRPVGRIEGEDGDLDPDDRDDLSAFFLFEDPYGYHHLHDNVTGDMGLDAPENWDDMWEFRQSISASSSPVPRIVLDLLSNPLPADLPTCNKNLLIFMSAYRGDLDRYCRLRRPYLVHNELEAIIRGIYHNTQFAKWWSTQPPLSEYGSTRIAAAITARFIMNDDISWALKLANGELEPWYARYPYLIFYPDIADSATYEALAREVPLMRPAVARAAIYANYRSLFDLVVTGPAAEEAEGDSKTVTPDHALWVEAMQSPESYYRETLERIAKAKGISDDTLKRGSADLYSWQKVSLRQSGTLAHSNILHLEIYASQAIVSDREDWDVDIYDGVRCSAIGLERYLSLPREWRPTVSDVDESTGERELDYKSWPPDVLSCLSRDGRLYKALKQVA